jgi:hypothetical protein
MTEEKCNKRGLKIWNKDVADFIVDQKKAYLKFLQTKTEADQTEYKRIRATVKKEPWEINRNSWDIYIYIYIYISAPRSTCF